MPSATSYNTEGIREHLEDWILRVEPEESPFISSLPKGPPAKQQLVEYQTDDLDAPTFGGVLEGEDQSTFVNQADGRETISTRMEKFRQTYSVTTEKELSDTAGVSSELARSKAKAGIQLKLSMESSFCSTAEATVQSGSTPYRGRGMLKWADSTNTNIPSSVRTPSASNGTTSSTTESTFRAVLQSVYEQYGRMRTYRLIAGPTLKNKVTDFTRAEGTTTSTPLSVNENAGSKKLTYSVMEYNGDYGRVLLFVSLFLERTSGTKALTAANREAGLLYTTDLVSLGYWKSPTPNDLPDNGAGPRGHIEAIAGVYVKNPLGLAKWT